MHLQTRELEDAVTVVQETVGDEQVAELADLLSTSS